MSRLPWDDPQHDVVGDVVAAIERAPVDHLATLHDPASSALRLGAGWLAGGPRSSPCSTCWFAGGEPDATHCGRCPCCPATEHAREHARVSRTAEGEG